jgi:hypothetical protein
MVMSSNIFAQRYVDGRSWLRYLPLFNTMNDTLTWAACPSCFKPMASEQRRRVAK